MKSILTAAAAAALLSAPALAHADDWSGWYAGVNLGGASGASQQHTTVDSGASNSYFAASSITAINADGTQKLKASGFTGGVQLGLNAQSGQWVWGVEGDIEALDVSKDKAVTTVYPAYAPSTYTVTQGVKTSWMATLRARAGLATSGGWLVYGTGGLAVANVKATHRFNDTYTAAPGALENGSTSKTKAGWTLGVGAEKALADGWSVRGEYLYADFGKMESTANLTNPVYGLSTTFRNDADLKVNIVRLAVSKRF